MNRRQTVLAIVLASVVATAVVSGLLLINQSYPNSGSILKSIGVQVYWDKACNNKVTSVPWGTLAPGQNATVTVYIKNNGTAAETLTIAFGNYTPTGINTQITPGWNCTNYVLPHQTIVCATIWLAISQSATATPTFTFDTTITGTEHA